MDLLITKEIINEIATNQKNTVIELKEKKKKDKKTEGKNTTTIIGYTCVSRFF